MRKLLQQFKKIVFFDTETTGLDPEKDQIIELAAALVTENGIELKIDAFCKLPEGEKIPEKIVELTHITDDMLADKGIDYREACRIFCNMLHSDSEVLLVAHNIQFDLLFILEMFKRCGMVPKAPKLRALDSLTVYKDRAAYPHKLANAIEHYGLADKVQNSHRAIDDVLALYEVTKAMSEERDDLTDYIDLLGYNPKYGITGRKLRQITYMPQSYKLGWRDVWSFTDKVLQAIENTEYIAGLRLVKENNIEYGPFTEDGALVSYYPYWFCWVQFTLEHGLARKIPADYEKLL